eukprot:CAMPEP_0119153234 /NCGR_PEP_ID=MMETSP1310-20130426/48922_1 /TAXON_ID=464262 /ORGANISM="Genus nov. species nov., Strain RCC2339" /LENGTH=1161 /DNA_ID=CAMNT_0007145669 /DNA_START=79 /DNA_END=3564 /DNA_ORIENTATION=+
MELNQVADQERELLVGIDERGEGKRGQKRKGWNVFERRKRRKHRVVTRLSYPKISISDREANAREDFPSNRVVSTKYTILNFVPKVLLQEFRRLTTLYFFLVCLITLFPALSPIDPVTSFAGLAFILVTAMLREGYEDLQRNRQDTVENNLWYDRMTPGEAHLPTRSQEIAVGDLLYIKNDQKVPADLVLVSTSDEHGRVYVGTSQLDGETALKQRRVASTTAGLPLHDVSGLCGTIDCEIPHHEAFDFRGTMLTRPPDGAEESALLGAEHFLPRGSYVRNTEWIVGAVVYAGLETKSQLNQQPAPSKSSTLDARLDRAVLVVFLTKLFICLVLAVNAVVWEERFADDQYVSADPDGSVVYFIKVFLGYFALLSYFIPLSLVVSLEIVKIIQARFIEWDLEMSLSGKSEDCAVVRASNVTDELGTVRYVFSDKTGTLTENKMEFAKCSVGGRVFTLTLEGQLRGELGSEDTPATQRALIRDFLVNMALNHSVIVTTDQQTGELIYHASSPDEACLCFAAQENQCAFLGRAGDAATLRFLRDTGTVEILHTVAFTSERRRMSILVRHPDDGRIVLYTKGADSEVLARARDAPHGQATRDHLLQFSQEGLRTLVLASRTLNPSEYEAFAQRRDALLSALQHDPAKSLELQDLDDELERNLDILGCTGIEDKLQDEVPQSLLYLREAGIKVWVITGDKTETAVNIGFSSNLLTPSMEVAFVTTDSKETVGDQLIQNYDGARGKERALVIDGKSLKVALEEHRSELFAFAVGCATVIVTRATPIQKAKVVELVMEKTKDITLAIGDGGNDVSMIQEAHVGVGIFGREGTSAVRSADVAIREFRHLCRLLAVHGRYCAVRNGTVTNYYFYKNAAVYICQMWFAFVCGFSAQTLFDDILMAIYNFVILAAPPIVYAVFEKDVDEGTIMRYPGLYRRTQSWQHFNGVVTARWWLAAIYHSVVLFFGAYLFFDQGAFDSNGQTAGLRTLGNVVMSGGILVVILELALVVETWNVIMHVVIWGTYLLYIGIFAIESLFPGLVPSQYYQFQTVFGQGTFYLWLLLTIVVCFAPEFAYRYYKQQYAPEDYQILRERHVMESGVSRLRAMWLRLDGQEAPVKRRDNHHTFDLAHYSWRTSVSSSTLEIDDEVGLAYHVENSGPSKSGYSLMEE